MSSRANEGAPVSPASRRMRQGDSRFEASLAGNYFKKNNVAMYLERCDVSVRRE